MTWFICDNVSCFRKTLSAPAYLVETLKELWRIRYGHNRFHDAVLSWSRNFPHLWNPQVRYRIHKCSPPVPTVGETSPVHAHPSHFLNIHFDVIRQPRLDLPSGFFPSRFPTKTLCAPLLAPIRAACTTSLILLNLITRLIFGEEYIV